MQAKCSHLDSRFPSLISANDGDNEQSVQMLDATRAFAKLLHKVCARARDCLEGLRSCPCLCEPNLGKVRRAAAVSRYRKRVGRISFKSTPWVFLCCTVYILQQVANIVRNQLSTRDLIASSDVAQLE